jgi:hypothetical protein
MFGSKSGLWLFGSLLFGQAMTEIATPLAAQDSAKKTSARAYEWQGSLTVEGGDSLELTLELKSCKSGDGRLTIEEEGSHPVHCRKWTDKHLYFSFGSGEGAYLCELRSQTETGGYVGPCNAAEDGDRLGRILIFPTGAAVPSSD